MLDCFDFSLLRNHLSYLTRLLLSNARVVQVSGVEDIHQLKKKAAKDIFVVSENFRRQLRAFFKDGSLPESDAVILKRISKASAWFQEKFTEIFEESVPKLHVETDNTELRKKVNNALNKIGRAHV